MKAGEFVVFSPIMYNKYMKWQYERQQRSLKFVARRDVKEYFRNALSSQALPGRDENNMEYSQLIRATLKRLRMRRAAGYRQDLALAYAPEVIAPLLLAVLGAK